MARMATIAIHAIVMTAMKDISHPYELDGIAAWFMLSEVATAVPIMLSWAPALKESRAKFLIKIWNLLVLAGALCGFVTLRWAAKHVDGRSCRAGTILNKPSALAKDGLFSKLGINTLLAKFDTAAIAAASLGLLINLWPEKSMKPSQSTTVIGKLLRTLRTAGLVFCSTILVAIIVLHERYLLSSPRLPMLLPITSYEQWNCWAAAGLVALATVCNWMFGDRSNPSSNKTVSHEEPWAAIGNEAQASREYSLWTGAIERPGRNRKSDLEWAGVVGKPTPSHVS